MKKEKFTISASSLGNYFGVGFISPLEQLDIDLGEVEPDFNEKQKFRMLLGTKLEDGMLNFFEEKLDVKITNRNTEVLTGFNGMLRYKIDGECIFDGEPTIVENKVSTLDFTKELGYVLQCNAYMESKGYNKAILCGLSGGDPIYRVLNYDKDLVKDIWEMITTVHSILVGILGKEDFPWHIVEKYSKTEKPMEYVPVQSDIDRQLMDELYELKKEKSQLEKREKELREYLEETYKGKIVDGDNYVFKVSTMSRSGGYDMNVLMLEHPEINFEQYRKPSTVSNVVRFSKK